MDRRNLEGWWLPVIAAIPFVALFGGIAVFGVNVPSVDSLGYIWLSEKFANHTATIGDFFAPYYEHIFAAPLYVATVILAASHGNYKLILFLMAVLALLSILFIVRISLCTNQHAKKSYLVIPVLCTAMLIASYTQWETWTYPTILAEVFGQTIFVAALWILTERMNGTMKLLITAMLCILCSFSFPNGMLSWLVLLPLIIAQRDQKNRNGLLLIVIVCFCITVGLEHAAIANIGVVSDRYVYPLHHPFATALNFLTILGAPLLPVHALRSVTALIGLGLLAGGVWMSVRALRGERAIRTAALPWICLFLFAVSSALLIALGRSFAGSWSAFISRYYSVTTYVAIAVLWLSYGVYPRKRIITIIVAGILCVSSVIFSVLSISAWEKPSFLLRQGAACLETYPIASRSCLSKLYPWTIPSADYVRDLAPTLEKLSFLKQFTLPKDLRFISHDTTASGALESITTLQPSNDMLIGTGTLVAHGWATLGCAPANHVYLTYGTPPMLLAHTTAFLPRPDLKNSCAAHAGWEIEFDPPAKRTHVIVSAWVYDASQNALVQLSGSVRIASSR